MQNPPTDDHVDWHRAKEIFADVLEAPHHLRHQLLHQATADQPVLLGVVSRLIDTHNNATDFMGEPEGRCGPQGQTEDRKPAAIGPYQLHEVIGEGGFGIVYRATQTAPIKRQVAIKLLKRGMDTERVVQRFQAERDVLGRLSHPGIATVLDAGATEDGRPFVVMELVTGEAITSYCATTSLGVRDRVTLLARVAQAVHHAHQRAVIHRDLKPSNILITEIDGAPRPCIIDFGIAKVISDVQRDDETQLGDVVGTPKYMSPEQMDGAREPDTRVDVYSLGVVLCEVLTGRVPRDPKTMTTRPLRESSAERPSQLARRADSDRHQSRSHRTPSRALRGDLDRIVLKCVDWDPDRRYDSAAALADDLGRYLRGEPVLAAEPGAIYQARKFIARHRLAAGLFTLTGASLIAGMALAVIGQIRAQDALVVAERAGEIAASEAERAKFVSAFLLNDMLIATDPDASVAVDRDVTVEALFREAERHTHTRLRGDRRSMFDILGRVGSGYLELRLIGDAIRTLEDSIRIGAGLNGAEAEVLDLRVTLSEAISRRDGLTESLARMRAETCREAVTLLGPTDPVSLRARMALLDNGVPSDEALIEVDDMLASEASREPELRFDLLRRRGVALRNLRRFDEEIDTRRQIVALTNEIFAPDHSAGMSARFQLGRAMMLGGHLQEAAVLFEELLMLAEDVMPLDHPGRMSGAALAVNLRRTLGEIDEARRIALYAERLSRSQHGVGSFNHALAAQLIGEAILADGPNARATEMIDIATRVRDELLSGGSSLIEDLLCLMSQTVLGLGEPDTANVLADAALSPLSPRDPRIIDACDAKVAALRALDRGDEARVFIETTIRQMRAAEVEDSMIERVESLLD